MLFFNHSAHPRTRGLSKVDCGDTSSDELNTVFKNINLKHVSDERKDVTNFLTNFLKRNGAAALKDYVSDTDYSCCDDSEPEMKATRGRLKAYDRVPLTSHLRQVRTEYRIAATTKGESTLRMQEKENYRNNCSTSSDEHASDRSSQSVKRKSEAHSDKTNRKKRRNSDVHTGREGSTCSHCHGKGRSRKTTKKEKRHAREMRLLDYKSDSSNGSTAGVPHGGRAHEPIRSGTY